MLERRSRRLCSFPTLVKLQKLFDNNKKCTHCLSLSPRCFLGKIQSNQPPLSPPLFPRSLRPIFNYDCFLLLFLHFQLPSLSHRSQILHSSHNTDFSLMGSISHVITTTLPHLPSTRSLGFPISHSNSRLLSLPPTRVAKKVGVFAEHSSRSSTASAASVDFSDPDWKIKFQEDWEARFRLPHLTDIFPNAPPIPSTFCLKMRLVGRSSFLLPSVWYCGNKTGKRVFLVIVKNATPQG